MTSHSSRAPRRTLILLLTAPLSAAIAAPAPPSLCGPKETPLFTCPIGHKRVSICAANGKATYYFGTPDKPEISSQHLFTADRPYAGGGETQISFKNKSYTYTVYNKTTRTSFSPEGHNDPDFTSGLIVQNNGRTISDTKCAPDANISETATQLIQPGPFIEH